MNITTPTLISQVIVDQTITLPALPASAPRYHLAATSDNTRAAYRADIKHFTRWGGQLPASTDSLIRYLEAYATALNPRTLQRRLTAIKQWHRYQGFLDPTDTPVVTKTLKGIFRTHGQPKAKARPLLPLEAIQIVAYLKQEPGLIALRDSALIQVGLLGALRASELLMLHVEHISFTPEGMDILLPASKTDALREGQHCFIPRGVEALCAMTSLQTWLIAAGIKEGVIFGRILKSNTLGLTPLTTSSVNTLLKARAKQVGLPHPETYSTHSLRRGITTQASLDGVNTAALMRLGRWKNVNTVMEYVEASNRQTDNAAGQVLNNLKNDSPVFVQ